ncbi:SDR family oxidoreductase [Pseudomonas sp. MM211]|uniref:oxidoreductase n=1 Tax=Pseudomonas sp. MM211 TaxID=2866808 RepID=UPI001CED8ACB|nr:oxidoreductase [Pseudomonas sp. MM211]UCJ15925.1 SDR family oxidoreductase [Pseudomonas sp. MM211]
MANWTVFKTPTWRSRTVAATRVATLSFKARPLYSRWRNGLAALGLLVISASAAGDSIAQSSPKPDWSFTDIPSQKGRIFLVTGGTSGIGYESAKALAGAGAQVVIAARDARQGEEAIRNIRLQTPDAQVRFEALDLADLASIRAFSEYLNATLPRLDGLINNAGIMEPPERITSADGFEMQFAVNYLGHFALTAELLPLLQKADSPRVVTLSSIAAARGGAIHFEDMQFERAYDSMAAYSQSKLACLMFARELQRRSDVGGWGIQSIASHPGVSRTNLLMNRGGVSGFVRRNLTFLFQPADQGALPTLYAATAVDAQGGAYYGPTGMMETRGPLGFAKVPPAATDADTTGRLWALSEELSGTQFP